MAAAAAAPGLSEAAAGVLRAFGSLSSPDKELVCAAIVQQSCLEELEVPLEIRPWTVRWQQANNGGVHGAQLPPPSRLRLQGELQLDVANQPFGSRDKCLDRGCAGSVIGCPWCKRPVTVHLGRRGHAHDAACAPQMGPALLPPAAAKASSADGNAYTTLLYGANCHEYFLGALVLGRSLALRSSGPGTCDRVLMYTSDVPEAYVATLGHYWNVLRPVEYLKEVSWTLFRKKGGGRFYNIFTKLSAVNLIDFKKVLLLDLDMLIRKEGLYDLFSLEPPAAMRRGPQVPEHGACIPYQDLWDHPVRRAEEKMPSHQQAGGINAGVMLLRPSSAAFAQMVQEMADYEHPEHYGTYMPEQEYIGRFYGTKEVWRHISCRFNFEVDKDERIPCDFSEEHARLRDSAPHEIIVFHYSGLGCKPWDLLLTVPGDFSTLVPATARDLPALLESLKTHGMPSNGQIEHYHGAERIFQAMVEWVVDLASLAEEMLTAKGVDIVSVVRSQLPAAG